MRFRDDKPGDLDRARAAVAKWRTQNSEGTREQMLTALSPGFHRDYGPVLGAVLSGHDRDHAPRITAHPAAPDQTPGGPTTTDRPGARPGPGDDMTSPAAQVATRYQRTFHGHADQVSRVRADITGLTAWTDGRQLWWNHGSDRETWLAASTRDAAVRLATLARASGP